uniref:Uncharacterized protein n=1 Tax=Nelumbo nucifera TaxID=4432 RepID=A0A822YHN9_NELNU|nr:TPA_asm: hypothetical protein HUJ06_009842 [Nelumbo nucifera]
MYLKPSHASETLDKDNVLRRIRHHKHVNKVQNALHALLSSPFSSGGADNAPIREQRWLDFARAISGGGGGTLEFEKIIFFRLGFI